MSGTISFGGVGSGIDTEGIVQGLVSANSGQLNAYKAQQTTAKSAVSDLSSVGSLLSTLSTAVQSLDDLQEARAYTATSSGSAVTASANGSAVAGEFSVKVDQLAAAQRSYSNLTEIGRAHV
jgi:flagellar hook-associated protein 2